MADIYRAAEAGNLKMLYKWLKNGTSPDSFLKATKATPLIWAARKSHPKAVKLLIRFKATLDMQDVKGNTALHYACQNNDRKTTLLLVEAGLTGILALIHADDSEEMEFSLANSDARDHISNAINKFGKKNVGLSRAGNTLINRVNEYEKEFSKFKNADSL